MSDTDPENIADARALVRGYDAARDAAVRAKQNAWAAERDRTWADACIGRRCRVGVEGREFRDSDPHLVTFTARLLSATSAGGYDWPLWDGEMVWDNGVATAGVHIDPVGALPDE